MRYAPGRFDLSDVQTHATTKPVRAFTCAPAVAGAELSDYEHTMVNDWREAWRAWSATR